MPYYDYNCAECGAFTEFRPMAVSAAPCDCPSCGVSAERAFFSTPFFSLMDQTTRIARATNEKSANEPKNLKSTDHGAGCACCQGNKKSRTLYRADGAKTFPLSRPWMISH